jgi:exodeoxyribonuclease V
LPHRVKLTPMLTRSDLSQDQIVAFDAILAWLAGSAFQGKRTLSLGGFAGSGKSTVVSVLAHELLKLGPLAFCAFTGKASSVLARKLLESSIATSPKTASRKLGGMSPKPYCGTIHGLVYAPCDVCMPPEPKHTCDESDAPCAACEAEKPEARKARAAAKKGYCDKCKNSRFTRRSALDRAYRLIIVDEASMVDDAMLADLLGYGVPILAVGDHGQLPPVKGAGSLMKNPDVKLEKIHRQAAGNPIIAMSAAIRETGNVDWSLVDGDKIKTMSRSEVSAYILSRFTADCLVSNDVLSTTLVTHTNRQRVALNHEVRCALGTANMVPQKGEAVICLKNKAPIYNGMRGVLASDARVMLENEEVPGGDVAAYTKAMDIDATYVQYKTTVDFVEDGLSEDVAMADAQLFTEKTINYETAQKEGLSLGKLGDLYDFGFAMTCHKMQGSSSEEVIVFLDDIRIQDREQLTRFLYTAVTRASKKLILVKG